MRTQAHRVFVVLIILSIGLVGVVAYPFAKALFFACVIAAALYRLYERITRLLRGRNHLAAGVVCFFVLIAIVAPIGGIASFVVDESIKAGRFIAQAVQSSGISGLLEQLPDPVRHAVDGALSRLPMEKDDLNSALQEQARAQGGRAAHAVTGLVAASGGFLLQAAMMIIALFCFLVDGRGLVRWLEDVSPLRRGQTTELLIEFRQVTGSVLISAIAAASVQAISALIGYLIARLPHPLFFTLVTFLLAFIPAVGAGSVVMLAALLTWASGHTWMAVFLVIWGTLVVGVVDNIIKPLLAKRGMQMHGAIVFFSLLGGLTMFGAAGLLAGPLIVSFFLALVRIYQRDYGDHPELVDATGRQVAQAGSGASQKVLVEQS